MVCFGIGGVGVGGVIKILFRMVLNEGGWCRCVYMRR